MGVVGCFGVVCCFRKKNLGLCVFFFLCFFNHFSLVVFVDWCESCLEWHLILSEIIMTFFVAFYGGICFFWCFLDDCPSHLSRMRTFLWGEGLSKKLRIPIWAQLPKKHEFCSFCGSLTLWFVLNKSRKHFLSVTKKNIFCRPDKNFTPADVFLFLF